MIKALLSPLVMTLLALVAGLAILFARWGRRSRLERSALVLLGIGTVVLLGTSMPLVAGVLANYLERQYLDPVEATLQKLDVVIILGGGILKRSDPENDDLVGATYSRVVCGVRKFKHSGARWLVMSGSSGKAGETRDGDLMKTLAMDLGIQPERILLEPFSRNTFEHPRELLKLMELSSKDAVGVVTSAWHVPRAMAEFKRRFQNMVAIPCGFYGGLVAAPTHGFLPQADALSTSTTLLHEYIGSVWYRMRHAIGQE